MQQKPHNGIPASRLEGAVWRKSQRSNSQGQCVELARLDEGTVAVMADPEGTEFCLLGPPGSMLG